jgi:hypothetical protein
MRESKTRERIAMDAVARRFSATWQGTDRSNGHLNVGGKRVAVDVALLDSRGGQDVAARPRLRFDRVAIGAIERLKAAVSEAVPAGTTVVVTITAPIRKDSKTSAAIVEKLHALLARKTPPRDQRHTIQGNHVRIRLLKGESARGPRLIGFVHNLDVDPLLLSDLTRELLELGNADFLQPRASKRADRWLVLVSARGHGCLQSYRHIYSQLYRTMPFEKTLIVFADGRVEELA